MNWLDQNSDYNLVEAEIIIVLSQLVHCILAEQKPLVYTHYHMNQFFDDYPQITKLLLKLWGIHIF